MRDRGQSTLVGFVMVVGIVVLLMVTLQTVAVPTWNQGVEFSHNQRVQGELELLRDDVFRTAATGSAGSESISLGTQYPVRPFLFNPPDPSGQVRTTDVRTVALTNATATGEAGDYWNGTTREFETRALVYRPVYNEYESAPETVYENTVLYNRVPSRGIPITETRLVEGRRINLVTLAGNLSRSGVRSYSVELTPLSAPQQVTTVRSDGPLVLTARTDLSEETWQDLLADQRVDAGGFVTDVSVTSGDPGRLRVTLAAGESYDLRMARVGVGSGLTTPAGHYVTTESASERQLSTGETERVVFEVRDRYNNPVSGVDVTGTLSGPGVLTPVDNVTDADGQAVFRYEATTAGEATVEATFGAAPEALQTATLSFEVRGGRGGDDLGPTVSDIDTSETTASGQRVPQGTVFDLTATASDFRRGGTDVYAVEWWSNRTAPGGSAGSGFALVPADGDAEFDAVAEDVVATDVDTSDWDTGWHDISVRARDANGNWGPVSHYEVRVTGDAETTAAESVAVVDGSAAGASGGNEFEFALDAGEESLTLTGASIDTATMPDGVRDGLSELTVDGTDYRSGDGTYASNGTTQALDDPTLTGTSTVRFRTFSSGSGNTRLPSGDYQVQSSEPAGEHVAVTLSFGDGSQTTLYFTHVG